MENINYVYVYDIPFISVVHIIICAHITNEFAVISGVGLTGVGLTGVGLTGVGITGVGLTGVGLTGVGLTGVGLTSVGLWGSL